MNTLVDNATINTQNNLLFMYLYLIMYYKNTTHTLQCEFLILSSVFVIAIKINPNKHR